jgi:hypothetical protein
MTLHWHKRYPLPFLFQVASPLSHLESLMLIFAMLKRINT